MGHSSNAVDEAPRIGGGDDRFFDLDGVARYCGLSKRTIQRLMVDPEHPFPSHHVKSAAVPGGKTVFFKREVDAYMLSFPAFGKPRAAKAEDPNDASWVRREFERD
jgi:predicted DNA-binding transcriptional regulator AlpA